MHPKFPFEPIEYKLLSREASPSEIERYLPELVRHSYKDCAQPPEVDGLIRA